MNRTSALLISGLVAVSFSSLSLTGQESAKPLTPAKSLTVEAIYGHGPLIGTQPDGLSWSPDGKHLTFMTVGELSEIEPGSDDAYVIVNRSRLASFSGTSASETDRDHRERYRMASYIWAPDSAHLLFDMSGHLWLYDLHSRTGAEVGSTGAASGDDPKFSPDGESISFIREHGLAVVRLKNPGTPMTVVAPTPNKTTLNGEVDWVYEEELDVRSNYFWSPDSKRLAYLQMNEADVPEYPIADWIPTHATVEAQRYPQPGDPNPAVRVGVVSYDGGKTVWVSLPIRAGQDYIPRFGWADAKTVWVETLTRDHKHLDLYFADAETGQAHTILQLTDDKFINEKYDVWVGLGNIVLANWTEIGRAHV